MASRSWKTVAAGLAAFALAASPAAAMPVKDYSQNGASGDFAPQQRLVKNYGLNGASGDFAPQVPNQTPIVASHAPTTTDGFAWGAALAGAGTTLLLVMALGGTLRLRRRTSGAPRVA